MTGTDYHILTRWELEASPQEVFDLIADAPSYPRWWPSVFLEARVLEPGDDRGVGRLVEVRTATFLLLSVSWRYRVTAVHAPDRLAVEASGDLEGLGLWTFEARGRTHRGALPLARPRDQDALPAAADLSPAPHPSLPPLGDGAGIHEPAAGGVAPPHRRSGRPRLAAAPASTGLPPQPEALAIGAPVRGLTGRLTAPGRRS